MHAALPAVRAHGPERLQTDGRPLCHGVNPAISWCSALLRGQNETVNTESVQVFSALLALGALAGSVVVLFGLFARPASGGLADVMDLVRSNALRFTLLLTGTAMIGSLYFSEAANYAPCKLCWYQRICMYSIAIVSLVGTVRREQLSRVRVLAPYVLALSVVGLGVSTYHYVLEWFPQLESSVCSLDVPCTTVWFRKFGFLTLPGMAWAAFAAVALVMVSVLRGPADDSPTDDPTPGGH